MVNKKLTVEEIELLEKTRSERALEYFRNETNLGEIENAESLEYTGACGEAMKLYLKISEGLIKESKFQYEGCPGLACCGSALCDLVKDKTVEEVNKINQKDILERLESSPIKDFDCPLLAIKTLEGVIKKYELKK